MRWWNWRKLTKRMADDPGDKYKCEARLIKTGGGGGDNECGPKLDTHITCQDFRAVHKVFALEMLREKIINYALRYRKGILNRKYLANLRLVGKWWLISVLKLLAKYHEPMYKLKLTKNNSLNGTPFVEAHGKLLDQFMLTCVKQRIILTYFPTLSLNILKEFFQFENYDSLYNCLVECGQGVVELELEFPQNGGSLPGLMPNLSFPILQKITVKLNEAQLSLEPPPESAVMEATNSGNVTMLLQSLLAMSKSLKELSFPFNTKLDRMPNGIQFIGLPRSITTITLNCRTKGQQPELLVRNALPYLTKLVLRVIDSPLPEGLLTRILQNLKNSLQSLEITGLYYKGPPRAINSVTFPVMPNLKKLSINSINCEPEVDILPVKRYFPILHTLELNHQTPGMFHKWTTGFQTSSTVVTLSMLLVQENIIWYQRGYHLPPTLKDMQRAHVAFPKVSSLTLNLTGEQTCGLKYMFKKMRQLRYLKLMVMESQHVENSNCWDSILTGVPCGVLAAMREHPEFCKQVDLRMTAEVPSIRMLTGLKMLALNSNSSTHSEAKSPLISDFTFVLSLMKMANLKTLYLEGRFKASEEISKAWRKLGRLMNATLHSTISTQC